ncbi:AraC family transcriptional regulator [Shimia ponticola]|uniref:AraC family transcriptional regulator n=1 Tax=Shimia ponticola TaxID=2582893 RepID=UPI0011BD6321|nr:AraC family transcriptional regulator [Shimia ponticola]
MFAAPTVFQIDNYLRQDEAYHFARKQLTARKPRALHFHDYHELMLIEDGSVTHWINGKTEVLTTGQMVFLRPDDRHGLQADAQTGCRILNIMFRNESADHLLARYPKEFAGRFFWSRDAHPTTLRLEGPQLERAINTTMSLRSSLRSLVRIEHFLLTMMTFVLDEVAIIGPSAPDWLLRACEAAKDPEVFRAGGAGFVQAAGRAQEHVCRQARKHLGASPTQYVNRIRIQHAAMLMAGTSDSLDQIAAECGFGNMSYFHRLFKDHYGTTPKEYRDRRRRDPLQSGLIEV